jgi:hypothetical protein
MSCLFDNIACILTLWTIVFVPIWLISRSFRLSCILATIISIVVYTYQFKREIKKEKKVTWNENVEVFEID